MTTPKVHLDPARITAFCRKWRMAEMSLFGSVFRDDFGPDSDVDFLVTFEPEAQHSFPELDQMEGELAELVGRRVDLVERRLVEQSENYIRRRAILNSAERIYAA
jgi:predicted nucleotidyltransferase